jgi:membrane-bound lytic murein transglycosylase B
MLRAWLTFSFAVLAALTPSLTLAEKEAESKPKATTSSNPSAPSGVRMQAVPPDHPEQVQPAGFEKWVASFRAEALTRGISAQTFDKAFKNVRFNPEVMERNLSQPEYTRQVWEYLESAASPERISNGKDRLSLNGKDLRKASGAYGVPVEIITAIWGLESSYGDITGDFNVIEALATLAYDGPRRDFGHDQLIAALQILDRGDITPARMTGSWAGAMGHTQFVPTTFQSYAVDGNGDGKRDLWGSLPDVFHSTANYLAKSGWQQGKLWGYEVKLPKKFAYEDADPLFEKPVSEWITRGVTRIDGRKLTTNGVSETESAALFLPAGHRGPAFLLLDNFRVILRYNNSTSYGLGVAHLSERLKGGGTIVAAWPRQERALNLNERMELQNLLVMRGFDVGNVDGVLGRQTRAAVREVQKTIGVVPDGFITVALLKKLRQISMSRSN